MRIPFLGRSRAVATDPVCHMTVDTKSPPAGVWEYKRQTYYFCGPGCNHAFGKDPEVYLSGEKKLTM